MPSVTVVATPEPDGPPRRNDDRTMVAAGTGRLAAERREREVEEELAGAGELEERAVDREENDERRRHVDRGAEDALERHVHHTDEPADVVAAVAPRVRQVRPEHRVREEEDHHRRHDPAGRAPRRLEHEHDERDAHHHVERVRGGAPVEEVVAADDRVDDGGDAEKREPEVDPAEPVAEPLRDREQQEDEEQHEADVRIAQRRGRDHPVRGVQVEERHRDRDAVRNAPHAPAEAVGRTLLGLDELLGLLQALFGDDRFCRRFRRSLRHGPPPRPGSLRRTPESSRRGWISARAGMTGEARRASAVIQLDALLREVLDRPRVKGITIAALVWCLRSKFSDFLVHPDHVFLLFRTSSSRCRRRPGRACRHR